MSGGTMGATAVRPGRQPRAGRGLAHPAGPRTEEYPTGRSRVSRLALSLKQPWAALLAAGRKTIEVRRWTTRYRGELLIHAANVDDERPEAWALVDEVLRPLAERRRGVIGVGVLTTVCAYA